MTLKTSLILISLQMFVFLSGYASGASTVKAPVITEEVIELVYERDCYIEFEERERQIKPLTLKDLEAL